MRDFANLTPRAARTMVPEGYTSMTPAAGPSRLSQNIMMIAYMCKAGSSLRGGRGSSRIVVRLKLGGRARRMDFARPRPGEVYLVL